jgi:ligand-binding sensor domain-containing protein/two-component sensor histidine kinase
MRREGFTSAVTLICAIGAIVMCWPSSASAEQLPIRHYGVYEGLPHSHARCIFQDSRGYLWVGTGDGLGRFDGYRFTTYATSDGLGLTYINGITEDHQGRVWVATNGGGVSCFVDWAPPSPSTGQQGATPRQKFVSYKLSDDVRSNSVDAFLFDSSGKLWCVTDNGLYRATIPPGPLGNVDFELIAPTGTLAEGAFEDSRGRLWFGNGNTIIEITGGRVVNYGPGTEYGDLIKWFAEDRHGRVLAVNRTRLLEFVEPSDPSNLGRWKPMPTDFTAWGPLHHLMVDHSGAIWVGAERGLIRYKDGRIVVYTTANGLSDDHILWVDEDQDRNLWIGTNSGGLCMLSGEPAVGFSRSDGLPDAAVAKLFQDRAGRVYVSTKGGGILELTESKVVPVEWSQAPEFRAVQQRILQDSKGDWWVGTEKGLFLFRGPDLRRTRGRLITPAEGGPEAGVVGEIYEDQKGRVWFGSEDKLYCIERSGQDGSPVVHQIPLSYPFPYRRFISDRSGALWLSTNALLSRVVDGRDSLVQPAPGGRGPGPDEMRMWNSAERKLAPAEGLPETLVRALWLDSRGWLWLGLRNNGVSVTKDPSADPLTFVNYTTLDGLSSNTVWSIAEDDAGRIYFGTGRGLDRLDPATGRIKRITAGEKLVGDTLVQFLKDRRGDMWVGADKAVVRLNPRAEPDPARAPPIYLTRIQAAGTDVPMPDAGAIEGPGLTLGPSDNSLLIEYVGLDFHSDHELKYQYKLEGADRNWSLPSDQRSVNYPSLAPGSYKFLVRAVNQEGVQSPEPAAIQVRVLPPVWRRWWFLAVAAATIALAGYGGHRYRVSRLVEMLQVRTRIASDLHDDVGSNLTRIAILSEVAHQQLGKHSVSTDGPLSSIARISRESVASMADIVWAIDPRRDTHQDLIRRMRQFAIEMLGVAGASVRMEVTGDDQPQRLGPDFRRQVFLMFKEAVNNAARHSGCSIATIAVRMDRRGLTLKIEDNGTGFDPARDRDGQGLASMQRRAESLGGQFEVSTGLEGTVVTLFVPWTRSRWRSGWVKGE